VTATIDWRCPRCRGPLGPRATVLACGGCSVEYPTFEGIPDLRVPGASWIDHERDRDDARRLLDATAGFGAAQMARHVYGWGGGDEEWVETRTRQLVEGPQRMSRELDGWLRDCTSTGPYLDLGCGYGQLLAAGALRGRPGVGVDVRLVWLLVAKRLIESVGGTPRLAAAMAEALPLADGAVRGVVSLDVVEHVGDVRAYLREIDRVTAGGGRIALATPNRYSLTAEPHVGIWGVGLVPRRWQKRYVRARRDRPYDFVELLSVREAQRLLGDETRMLTRVLVPPVPAEELARFPPRRRAVARLYNRLARAAPLAPLFHLVGPFFRIVGRAP
jgi:SAM-dependent methyltransferase